MKKIETGAPHFKSVRKQHRHANYTIYKFINEAIDNIIKKDSVTEIRIKTDIDDNNRLQKIVISDNYIKGFENINEKGYHNPFNMGHISSMHDDDDETSEFGVGLKAGAISSGNQLTVISRVNGICYEVVCDFIRMSNEPDVNESYNPVLREIPLTDYKHFYFHPYDYGSSIIVSSLFDNACEKMSHSQITLEIKKSISNTYSRFLPYKKIYVNDELVSEEINFFNDPKCIPFSTIQKIYILGNTSSYDNIFIRSKKTDRTYWHIYDQINKKWTLCDKNLLDNKIKEGYKHLYRSNDNDLSSIEIVSTFTFFSDHFNTDTEVKPPEDTVNIYKDNRKYGNKALKKHNNGINNYTIHKIDFISKKIGKEFNITFNKDITMDKNNDLTCSVKLAIDDARKHYSADTSTEKYYELYKKAKNYGFNMDNIILPSKMKKVEEPDRITVVEKIEEPEPITVVENVEEPEPITVVENVEEPEPITVEKVEEPEPITVEKVEEPEPITTVVENVEEPEPITTVVENVEEPEPNIVVEKVEEPEQNIDWIEEPVINSDSDDSSIIDFNDSVKKSKEIIIKVAKMLMIKASSDDFNLQLEKSEYIYDFIEKNL
jgi:hypothetical protein